MKQFLVFFLLAIIFFPGCVENDKGRIIEIKELQITFQIEYQKPITSSYILIPTLITEEGNPIKINYIEQGDGIINFTIEQSCYGLCLNISFTDYEINNIVYNNYISDRIFFTYESDGKTINTNKEYDIKDRYILGLPGLSIWEKKEGKVFTRIYTEKATTLISLHYDRGIEGENLSDWTVNGNINQSAGWHELELKRGVVISPDETD